MTRTHNIWILLGAAGKKKSEKEVFSLPFEPFWGELDPARLSPSRPCREQMVETTIRHGGERNREDVGVGKIRHADPKFSHLVNCLMVCRSFHLNILYICTAARNSRTRQRLNRHVCVLIQDEKDR